MHSNDSDRIADLERRVDFLIRYLGIDPAHVPGGVAPADTPGWTAAGGVLPSGLEVAPQDERGDAELGAVYDLVHAGKKIDAIKRYRTLTGASLAEAKNAVDSIARGL
jgi:ribosomal protein L7/L12